MSETAFHEEVDRAVELYEQVSGHSATRTWPMLEGLGYVEALSRLMVSGDLQKGFKALRDSKQIDKTFESVVVRYKHLFRVEIVQAAQWRLDHSYDLL